MHPALVNIELPDSVVEALAEMRQAEEEAHRKLLKDLTQLFLDERKTAIDGRASSGIEDIWEYCEQAYTGIDAANQHEFHSNRWMKPTSPEGGVITRDGQKADTSKCSLYIPFTRRYVNAGVAKVQEILLAPDERPFGAEPTPVPELVKQMKDTRQIEVEGIGLERDQTPKEVNPGTGGTPEHPLPLQQAPDVDTSQEPGKKLTYAEVAAEKMQMAVDAAEMASKRMHDSMVECRFAMHDRRVIQDSGRIGTGIMKGPIPAISRGVVATKKKTPTGDAAMVVEVRETITPDAKRVSPWKFYPDPGCGEDIQNGAFTWEEDDLSRASLQKLAKMRGYNRKAIAQILRDGPDKRLTGNKDYRQLPEADAKALPYQAWYRYGVLTRAQFEVVQRDLNNPVPLEAELQDVFVQATIVNDTIIQLVQQPNEKSGQFPYHIFKWLDREGHWTGIGIAEQGMPAQRVINGAVRRLMDNAGFSAGLQILIDPDMIEPVSIEGVSNPWVIQHVKLWRKKVGTVIDDMRKAMHTVQFPNAQAQLSWIIEFGIRLFEETTNIPLITQGWSGKTTPETLGGTELQDSNANQMLRDVAMNHDHGVIVPYMHQRYEWHLLDETVPDEEKGDIKIFARGSTVMLDRYLQRQVYERHMPMLLQGHVMFKIDPELLFEEVWRGYRLNPKAIQYSEAKAKQLAQQPPPEPPEVTVAKMRGEIEIKKAEFQHDYNMKELGLRREIAQFEYQTALAKLTSEERRDLEGHKASLAEVSMELATQKDLFFSKGAATPEVASPPMEPVGRAKDGHSYEQ